MLSQSILSHAASSPWQDLGGGRIRLLATLDPNTQVLKGGIEIELKDGWSTYWRNPGSVGIAPKLEVSASNQLTDIKIYHPSPLLVKNPFGSYAGYKKAVTFLFEGKLANTQNSKIKSEIFIGLCSDICIPAQASLEIDGKDLLASDPKAMQHLILSQFKLPKLKDPEEIVDSVRLKDEKTLLINFKQTEKPDSAALFIEGPEDWYLTPGKLVEQNDTLITFEVDVSKTPEGADILNQKLRYTLVSNGKSVETTR